MSQFSTGKVTEKFISVHDDVYSLRNELDRLKKDRDALKQAIEEEQVMTDLTKMIAAGLKGSPVPKKQALQDFQEQLVQDILAGCKERQIADINIAYRLSGRTMFPVKDHHAGIRFETFYGGKYQEPYYVILKLDPESENLVIAKHTIPHFIPIRTLEKEYLNSNIDIFMNHLDDYIQAFVSRREQVKTLREEHLLSNLSVTASNAYNYVEIILQKEQSTAQINLMYGDIKQFKPDRLVIFEKPIGVDDMTSRRRLQDKEELFMQHDLPEAFIMAFGNI